MKSDSLKFVGNTLLILVLIMSSSKNTITEARGYKKGDLVAIDDRSHGNAHTAMIKFATITTINAKEEITVVFVESQSVKDLTTNDDKLSRITRSEVKPVLPLRKVDKRKSFKWNDEYGEYSNKGTGYMRIIGVYDPTKQYVDVYDHYN